jgi:hypothetical protein
MSKETSLMQANKVFTLRVSASCDALGVDVAEGRAVKYHFLPVVRKKIEC